MPTQAGEQHRSWHSANIIQRLEELVDLVFNQHHFISIPTPPPTLRLIMEEFPELQELQKAACQAKNISKNSRFRKIPKVA